MIPIEQISHMNELNLTQFNNQIAIKNRAASYSYRKLAERIAQLSSHFHHNGISAGIKVAVYLERDLDMIPSILAIWRLGGIFIPLDRLHPAEYTRKIIETSDTDVLVCNSKGCLPESLNDSISTVYTDTCGTELRLDCHESTPEDVAYIYCTSGSTGQPKGVEVSHKAFAEFIQAANTTLHFNDQSRVLASSTITFDISLVEIIMPLHYGSLIYIADDSERLDPHQLSQTIRNNQLDFVQATPSYWSVLLETDPLLTQKRTVISSGEPLSKSLARQILNTNCTLFNGYGPTESTVWSLLYEVKSSELQQDESFVIAGKLPCCSHLLLDDEGNFTDAEEGELAISGSTLANGYYRKPEETEQKFVTKNHPDLGELRLYRTGDRVRKVGTDRFAFLGRIDRQVKISGQRIELGYIEYSASEINCIDQCAVILHETTAITKLVMFYSGNIDEQETILSTLKQCLPKAMLPSKLVNLGKLPTNSRGKIDYKALEGLLTNKTCLPHASRYENIHPLAKLVQSRLGFEIDMDRGIYEQGLNSIDAMRITNLTRKMLEREASATLLFSASSIQQWFDRCEMKKETKVTSYGRARCTATKSQQAMYHLHQLYTHSKQYHITRGYLIADNSNLSTINNAILQVFKATTALNTVLCYEDNHVILKHTSHNFAVNSLHADNHEPAELLGNINALPLDICAHAPAQLWNVALPDQQYLIAIKLHHYAIDGWGFEQLLEQINRRIDNSQSTEFEGLDYFDFCHNNLHSHPDLAFWTDYLKGAPETHNLPFSGTRGATASFKGRHFSTRLSTELTRSLKALTKQYKCSLFNLMSCLFALLVAKVSRTTDTVIGTPFTNRNTFEGENTIGYFAQFLPVRYQFDKQQTLGKHLKLFTEQHIKILAQQDIHFEDLIELINPERDLSLNPLTQLAFVVQPEQRNSIVLNEVKAPEVRFESNYCKFDLLLEVEPDQDQYVLTWEYDCTLFNEDFISVLDKAYHHLCHSVGELIDKPISEIALTKGYNPQPVTKVHCEHSSVLESLALNSRQYATNVAVECNGSKLSYSQLFSQARQTAHYLISECGVKSGDRVALAVARNIDLPVLITGIMLAGAAYVPIDPTNPPERIQHILHDSQSCCILTDEQALSLSDVPCKRVEVSQIKKQPNLQAELPTLTGDSIAYIIYTSGSTGKPKGVMVSHHNLLRLMEGTRPKFDFSDKDTWLLFHSYAFDFSVWEIWGAFFYGGKLVVIDAHTTTNPEDIAKVVQEKKVSVLNQTPMAFFRLAKLLYDRPNALRYIIFGGEELPVTRLKPWFAHPQTHVIKLINMYGITETTVHATYREITVQDVERTNSPIGRCLPDLQAFILDENQLPVPDGVPGELYLAGEGVTQGYLNSQVLTDSHFLSDTPFDATGRIYRTGDLVRFTPDSTEMEFLGRIDKQVKIRGYRIELGEIEQVAMCYPTTKDVTVAIEDIEYEQKIILFIVCANGNERAIRTHLSQFLPVYMCPHQIQFVSSIPTNHNGKVDHPALFALLAHETKHSVSVDCEVLSIIARVLNRKEVLANDNFFRLGGDSILSLRLINELRKAGFQLELRDLYRTADFAELKANLVSAEQMLDEVLPLFWGLEKAVKNSLKHEKIVEDAYPLSSLQLAMVSHNLAEPDTSMYHDVFNYQLALPVDLSLFQNVISAIINSQPVLRTQLLVTEQGIIQKVLKHVTPPVEVIEPSAAPQDQIAQWIKQQKQTGFAIEQDLLYRIALVPIDQNRLHFLISFHHAIIDGWSMSSFISEIITRYRNKHTELSTYPNIFKQSIYAESENSSDSAFDQFWREEVESAVSELFPHPFAPAKNTAKKMLKKSLGADKLAQARSLCNEHGLPLQHLLYATHLHVLSAMTGHNYLSTCMVTGIRPTQEHSDRVFGLFLNSLPLALDVTQCTPLKSAFEVRDKIAARQAFTNYPTVAIREITHHSFTDVLFNYTHFHNYRDAFDDEFRLDSFEYFEETNFKLYVHFSQPVDGEELIVNVVFDEYYLSKSMIERYFDLFDQALSNLELDLKVSKNKALLESENKLVDLFPSLNSFLAQHITLGAEKEAIRFGNESLTYHQVGVLLNELSKSLTEGGITRQQKVILQLPRGIAHWAFTLAIANIGAQCVPVPINYPAEKQTLILSTCAPEHIITSSSEFYDFAIAQIASCINVTAQPFDKYSGDSSDTAWVLYTSGSTGEPKGVQIPPRTLLNLVEAQANDCQALAGEHTTLQFASSGFDVSLQEMFTAFSTHSTLVLLSESQQSDIREIVAVMEANQVVRFFAPNAVLQAFAKYLIEHTITLEALQCVISAGERLILGNQLKCLFSAHPDARLINHYGPTETHVVTAYQLPELPHDWPQEAPIGQSLQGCDLLVMGENFSEVADGMSGELWVSGSCVTNGYAKSANTENSRFLSYSGRTWYRTGDIVRLNQAKFEYLGRTDHQIKLRGIRIEIGEMESVLASTLKLDSLALCIEKQVGIERLHCFYVSDQAVSIATFNDVLSQRIMSSLYLSSAVHLSVLPRTINGKVDRQALLLGLESECVTVPSDEPLTEVQQWLIDEVCELLKLPYASIGDNLIGLGGHSLYVTQLAARVHRHFDFELPLSAIYQAAEIKDIAAQIEYLCVDSDTEIFQEDLLI